MSYILSAFKAVSFTFAVLAVATGVQALWDPVGFAASFGIPIHVAPKTNDNDNTINPSQPRDKLALSNATAASYVALMGVRQLATGITLLTFVYQGKWNELGTLLVILGFLVAGTDGVFLYRSGAGWKGPFHALPGAGIALLAGAAISSSP
jgi:hypothetical protein